MFSFKKAKAQFLKDCKALFKTDGFDVVYENSFIKETETGHQKITCEVADYNNLSTSVEFEVRFKELDVTRQRARQAIPKELWPKDYELFDRYVSDVSVSWNALVGNPELTMEVAVQSYEIDRLAETWHDRYRIAAPAFFNEFRSFEVTLEMFVNESPKLEKLYRGNKGLLYCKGGAIYFCRSGQKRSRGLREKTSETCRQLLA